MWLSFEKNDSHILVNAEANSWLARIQPPEKRLFSTVGGPLGRRYCILKRLGNGYIHDLRFLEPQVGSGDLD